MQSTLALLPVFALLYASKLFISLCRLVGTALPLYMVMAMATALQQPPLYLVSSMEQTLLLLLHQT